MKFNKDTLSVNDIRCYRSTESGGTPGVQVLEMEWSCNIGWGIYSLYFEEAGTKIVADSECMDKGENKEFLMALFEKILEKVEVVD